MFDGKALASRRTTDKLKPKLQEKYLLNTFKTYNVFLSIYEEKKHKKSKAGSSREF